jgi:hypothetical protein
MALATLLEHAVPTATDWIGSRPRLGDRHPETAESPSLRRKGRKDATGELTSSDYLL